MSKLAEGESIVVPQYAHLTRAGFVAVGEKKKPAPAS